MFDLEEMIALGKDCGFSHVGELKADTIHLLPEVRQMCEQNTCHRYGASWRCPPGCGTLEECEQKVRRFHRGILVQTTGELEDELDGETMMETEADHKKHFEELLKLLEERFPGMMALGAGTCTKCKVCTYPDEPCRFPEHSFSSMEAFGMLVTDVCTANNIKYYYGPLTITYTSCFLLE